MVGNLENVRPTFAQMPMEIQMLNLQLYLLANRCSRFVAFL
jgi:hypothetical protein